MNKSLVKGCVGRASRVRVRDRAQGPQSVQFDLQLAQAFVQELDSVSDDPRVLTFWSLLLDLLILTKGVLAEVFGAPLLQAMRGV